MKSVERIWPTVSFIQLDTLLQPLINLIQEVQNNSDNLQADEARIQVLQKESKTAQFDK